MNSKREIIKTSRVQNLFVLCYMERTRKGSDVPKTVGVTVHPTKIFSNDERYILFSFYSVRALDV